MLRITRLAETASHVTLLIEGQIRLQWVAELERQARSHLEAGQGVVLDFAGLRFVSPDGAEMLKRLAVKGVQFLHCPAIVRDLLD